MTKPFKYYEGSGKTLKERNQTLPEYEPFVRLNDPKDYIAEKGLADAVNVALNLGQPLLVTGEPGTGKTRLANSVAYELGVPVFEFHTKTSSTAPYLFYQYDALGRFRDSHIPEQREKTTEDYITYQALGKAVLLTDPEIRPRGNVEKLLSKAGLEDISHPTRSVVLIDEIDKAPRDFPNDLLNEIELMQFTVIETETTFRAGEAFRPVLILTSNSERDLPEAFLRRCVFFHISFPSEARLKEIVQRRFRNHPEFTPAFIESAITHFSEIRKLTLKKKPATGEFLSWISILKSLNPDMKNLSSPGQAELLALSYSVLAKSKEDLVLLKKKLLRR